MTKLVRWLRSRPATIGFAMLGGFMLLTAIVGYRIDRRQDDSDRRRADEAQQRVVSICKTSLEDRQLLRDLALLASPESTAPVNPDLPQSVQDLIARSRARQDEFRRRALALTSQEPEICASVKDRSALPIRADGILPAPPVVIAPAPASTSTSPRPTAVDDPRRPPISPSTSTTTATTRDCPVQAGRFEVCGRRR